MEPLVIDSLWFKSQKKWEGISLGIFMYRQEYWSDTWGILRNHFPVEQKIMHKRNTNIHKIILDGPEDKNLKYRMEFMLKHYVKLPSQIGYWLRCHEQQRKCVSSSCKQLVRFPVKHGVTKKWKYPVWQSNRPREESALTSHSKSSCQESKSRDFNYHIIKFCAVVNGSYLFMISAFSKIN